MKKIILSVILAVAAVTAFAQPKAIGARIGADLQASYEHNVGDKANFVEVDLGLELLGLGLNAAGSYNFMIAQPEWTPKGEWGFYAGPLVKAGYIWVGGYASVGAQVGLEYTFDFPLQLSVDLRPALGAYFGSGYAGFYSSGLLTGFVPCLSVRYSFGRK